MRRPRPIEYLEAAGYGLHAAELTPASLGRFLERVPDFEKALARYAQDGNRDLLAKLDEVLAAVAGGGGAAAGEEADEG